MTKIITLTEPRSKKLTQYVRKDIYDRALEALQIAKELIDMDYLTDEEDKQIEQALEEGKQL